MKKKTSLEASRRFVGFEAPGELQGGRGAAGGEGGGGLRGFWVGGGANGTSEQLGFDKLTF